MAIVVDEKPISSDWDYGTVPGQVRRIERIYTAKGSADDDAIYTAVASASPATYQGLARKAISFEPEWVDEVADDGVWECRVRYERAELLPIPVGGNRYAFDSTGGTRHITHAEDTRGYGRPGLNGEPQQPAPKTSAINEDGDNVEGTDIVVPSFQFTETHVFAASYITAGFISNIFNLTGTVNDAWFRSMQLGECLFMGATGASRDETTGEEDWEITYKFAGLPTRVNFKVGDIPVMLKRGWDYMWVRFGDEKDEETDKMVKVPEAVYVQQVYPYRDFSYLGIG